MRFPMLIRLLATLVPFTVAAVAAAPPREYRYTNARYGFSVSYPADQLTAQPETDNGDGRRLANGEDVTIAVFALGRLDERTPEYIAAEADRARRIP